MPSPRPRLRWLALALLLCTRCGGSDGPSWSTASLVVLESSVVPAGTTGASFSARLVAHGPHEPLVWLVPAGRLPRGLLLGDDGSIVGVPRDVGRFRFTVEVRDGDDPALARDATVAAARREFAMDVERGPLVVLPPAADPVQFGAYVERRVEAAGGTPPYAYDLEGGSLPEGLVLEREGLVRGTPVSARGPFLPRVRATDSLGAVAVREVEVKVVVLPLGVSSAALPDAAGGFPYAAVLEARPAGGGPPYAWAIEPPTALPAGLSLDPLEGRVKGTPTTTGAFSFTVAVTDLSGQTARRDVSLVVNPGPVLASVSPSTRPKDGSAVTLSGQGFAPGLRATFGVAPSVATTFVDAQHALAVAPSAPLQSGSVAVTIENPDGGRYVKPGAFRYPYATVVFEPQGVKGTARDHSRGIAVGDVDRDGLADVVHVGSQGMEVTRPSRASPSAALVWSTTTVRSDGSFDDVRLADVDADGDLDVVVLRSSTTETLEVYANDGKGHFPAQPSAVTEYVKPSSFHNPDTLAVGDVTGDGVVDVAFTSGRGAHGVLYVYRGLGTGAFVEVATVSGSIHDGSHGLWAPAAVALGDLDGDGRDDYVVTDTFPSACTVGQSCPDTPSADLFPGTDDVVAWTALSGPGGAPAGWRPVRVSRTYGVLDGDNAGCLLYDHDGDGHLDLAVFGGYQDLRGRGVAFLTGDGAGGFVERFVQPTSYDRRYGAALDANLDGIADVLVVGGDGTAASGFGTGLSVAECFLGGVSSTPLRAWTSGAEQAAGGSIPGANPGRVTSGDFDGDGLLDFAVDQSFNTKQRYGNDQGDGSPEGVAIYLNRSR